MLAHTPARSSVRQTARHTAQRLRPFRSAPLCCSRPNAAETADVVVVGSGVIGLCIAHRLLSTTDLSVVLVDRQQPCAGATGAGQGYLWMCHRDPSSPTWDLAVRGKQLWQQLAAGSSSLAEAMEWQSLGSLLLGSSAQEVAHLSSRALMLQQQGVEGVDLLDQQQMKQEEPSLSLPQGAVGLRVSSDAQLNGKATAWALLEECQRIGALGRPSATGGAPASRCHVLFHEDVTGLESLGPDQVTYVSTSKRKIHAKLGVVVAAGTWTGHLLAAATGQPSWQQLIQPRRGHLLEVAPPGCMPRINHGIMEVAYTKHYSRGTQHHQQQQQLAAVESPGASSEGEVDITFTATTSKTGTLLIGSSREFSGWQQVPHPTIISAIMERAATFLPDLGPLAASFQQDPRPDSLGTRVGLRPFAVGGLPAVGWVPGLPGVAVAAGHEGSGLCLGPATAELLVDQVLLRGGGGKGGLGRFEALTPAQRLTELTAIS